MSAPTAADNSFESLFGKGRGRDATFQEEFELLIDNEGGEKQQKLMELLIHEIMTGRRDHALQVCNDRKSPALGYFNKPQLKLVLLKLCETSLANDHFDFLTEVANDVWRIFTKNDLSLVDKNQLIEMMKREHLTILSTALSKGECENDTALKELFTACNAENWGTGYDNSYPEMKVLRKYLSSKISKAGEDILSINKAATPMNSLQEWTRVIGENTSDKAAREQFSRAYPLWLIITDEVVSDYISEYQEHKSRPQLWAFDERYVRTFLKKYF